VSAKKESESSLRDTPGINKDVCIIGGGLVGLAAALVLRAQGRSVSLIERSLQQAQPEFMDVRSIALSLSSIRIFQALDLLPALLPSLTPISDIHISSAGYFGVTRLHAAQMNLDAMGYVVEYPVLLDTLLTAARQDDGIEIHTPAEFIDLQGVAAGSRVTIRQDNVERQIKASVVLVADGAHSAVRDLLEIDTKRHDYRQAAVITNVEVKRPLKGWAYERFTTNGPLAMLPLSERRYALVWTRKGDQADALMQLCDEDFMQQLHRDFGYRLGFFKRIGRRDRFDLNLIRAQKLVEGRCVLIGNAANSLHPVAGQGFNLALRDISGLYDSLLDADLDGSMDQRLADYQARRMRDQQQTITLGHGLVELFSNDLALLDHARAGALALMDVCPAVKQAFSWTAMGYGAGVSSLMRGVK